ncbi:MFS transporter [Streptomyces sp. DH10]|uniref:MFS transporter n=1 Tax=Streptomyces sp. DH10 TaxID=3040121 RepID=UPI003FA699A4
MTGVEWRFRAVVVAHAVSAYGTYLNLIALSLFSYEVTGTALGVGVVMAVRLLSGVTAGLAAGALTARFTRRTVMVVTDLAQTLAMVVLALRASDTPLWVLLGAVVVLGAGNTFFNVALRSAVPVMVGQDDRARANGVLVTARSVATVLGFASAAPVIALGGFGVAFAVNAASFAVSAAAVLVLRPRTDDEPSDESGEERAETGSSRARGKRTRLRVAGLAGALLGMIALRGLDALASASHNVALPLAAHAAEPSDPAVFMTRFWSAWAVGTLLAHQVLKRRSHGASWGERAFAVGTCAMSFCFVAAFTGLPAPALMAAAVAAGFADGWTEIVYTSRLQAAPDRQRSRLFGLSATAEQSGFALGTMAAAAALEVLPALAVVGAFHGAAVCGALVLLLFMAGRRGTGRPGPADGDAHSHADDGRPPSGESRPSAGEGHPSPGEDRPPTGENHPSAWENAQAVGGTHASTGQNTQTVGETHPSTDQNTQTVGETHPITGQNTQATGETHPSTGGNRPPIGHDRPPTGEDHSHHPPSGEEKGEHAHGTSTGASQLPGS